MNKYSCSKKYNRVLLKLSGESLQSNLSSLDPVEIDKIAADIAILNSCVQMGIVIGGGNICRGSRLSSIDRVAADNIGMLATAINGIALLESLKCKGIKCRIMSHKKVCSVVEGLRWDLAKDALDNGEIVIFVGGTANPFLTTDSAACIRALEIKANILLKATKVDGVYSADPNTDPGAKLYPYLKYDQVLNQKLKAMDLVAFALAQENNLPICVFNMYEKECDGNLKIALAKKIKRIIDGKCEGTLIL